MIIDKQNATFIHNASLVFILLYSKQMLHPISNIPSRAMLWTLVRTSAFRGLLKPSTRGRQKTAGPIHLFVPRRLGLRFQFLTSASATTLLTRIGQLRPIFRKISSTSQVRV